MTTKTVIYRYLKKQGMGVKTAYSMASELSTLILDNENKSH